MDSTMTFCDSVATCVKGTAATCQPCMKDAGACCSDVFIVVIICGTILLLAIFAILAYIGLKVYERKAQNKLLQKQGVGANSDNKVKAEYISKLLKHLESLSINENVGKYNDEGSKRYIKELKSLILKGTVTNEKEES